MAMIEDQATSNWTLAPEGTEVHATAEAWKLLSHGDHIVVMGGGWRHGYAHHGIVLRESRLDQDPDIAHFTSPSGDRRMRDARLQIDTYINFLARHTTYGIVQYTSPTDFADKLVHRKRAANIAKLMVETPSMALRKYDLIHWNCECFAWICKTGGLKHNSDQVYRVLRDICVDIQKGDKSLLRNDGFPCSRTVKNGVKYYHDHVNQDDSFKEESNASEEPMTTTVEDYDALVRELENCRIKNQTLIKHNDELKLISETTMHENILLKSQLVPELSPYHFGHDLLTSLNMPFCNTKCCIVLLDSSGARQCKKTRQATGLLCTIHASSPKHVAEKVNKAYATRCFETHAKMQRQKRALLVSPSYATPGLDIRTRYVMEKTGVLPSDLGKYSTEGFARDAALLRRQLGPGFSFETLEGEGSPQHGSLVCSFKQLVTAEAIECVAEKFKGTFVRLLNMCDAEGESTLKDGQGTRDAVRLRASSAAVKSAYDSAVSASNQTYGIGALDSNGDILLRGNLRISETANIYKGYTHAMYMTSNGIVVSAGSDANGQLGRGASSANVVINANIVPMLMPDGSNVSARAISAGGYHSAVLLNNGSAYLCGKNDQGQCGASPTLVPQANSLGIISTLSNVVDVACGHEHTLFTRYDGQVLGFGRNDRGQLGQGNKTSPVTSVVQVLAGGGAGSSNGLSVEIAAGFNHSAYIKNDNTIFVFGANDKGQLGLGQTTTESLTPTQLVGYAGYDIACGRNHTVISTTPDPLTFNYTGNNALIAFGDNAYGQANIVASWTRSLRLRNHEGLVVVTDKNAYASGMLRGRLRAMTINQALPLVSLSKVPKDPRAFGVISLTQDHPAGPSAAISDTELLRIAEQGDVRVQINSIGEGCIWVCDETGSTIHADGSLVYTIVTTTQGPSVVDSDTGETRTGEPLETPIPVTEPAYEMRWMTTEIDASSGVSITTLISKEDYEKRGIIQFGEGGSSTISFSNAPDTGLFNPVARTLGVVAGGTEMVRVSDTTVSLLGDLVVSSNIVPMTNATQYLGTSTMHFKEAWIDELHISSNTLYIGDTPVLCADNDAVSIRADPGQGITLTTTGDGETSLVSAKGVNVVSEGGVTMRVSGPLGRVNIQSSGAGGTVNLGAEKEIVMTAPLTTISSNMIVKGDLTVEGTQLTLNTQTVTVEDNIIVLNSGTIGCLA
eukprot:gene29237-biopygen8540